MTNNAPLASVADAQSHFISVGANRIHYVTAGKGSRTIVFIHGWAGNLGFWREQVPALADKARLILIDLPGHGQSDKPQTAYTMDFFADAVLAVLRRRQAWTRPFSSATAWARRSSAAFTITRRKNSPRWFPWTVCSAGRPARPKKRGRWSGRSARRNISITPEAIHQHFFSRSRHRSVARPRDVGNARHAAACHAWARCWACSARTSPIGFCRRSTRPSPPSTLRVRGGTAALRRLCPLALAAIGLRHDGRRGTFSHAGKTRGIQRHPPVPAAQV